MAVLIDKTIDSSIKKICAAHANRPEALLEILHDVQAEKRFISDASLRAIADIVNISRAEIHGVVSFYHDFRRTAPPATFVQLCRAEACQAVGSEVLAADIEARYAQDETVEIAKVYCLGNCALGPAAMVDGELLARLTPERLDAVIEKKKGEA